MGLVPSHDRLKNWLQEAALLFLDKDGNLFWRTDGELDQDQVTEKLKEFGA